MNLILMNWCKRNIEYFEQGPIAFKEKKNKQ